MWTPPPFCQTITHVSKSEHPIGAMEEPSGQVQKASTYGSSVRVDIAVVEHGCAAVDVDATSVLPNNKSTSVKSEHPIGAMGWFHV